MRENKEDCDRELEKYEKFVRKLKECCKQEVKLLFEDELI